MANRKQVLHISAVVATLRGLASLPWGHVLQDFRNPESGCVTFVDGYRSFGDAAESSEQHSTRVPLRAQGAVMLLNVLFHFHNEGRIVLITVLSFFKVRSAGC